MDCARSSSIPVVSAFRNVTCLNNAHARTAKRVVQIYFSTRGRKNGEEESAVARCDEVRGKE